MYLVFKQKRILHGGEGSAYGVGSVEWRVRCAGAWCVMCGDARRIHATLSQRCADPPRLKPQRGSPPSKVVLHTNRIPQPASRWPLFGSGPRNSEIDRDLTISQFAPLPPSYTFHSRSHSHLFQSVPSLTLCLLKTLIVCQIMYWLLDQSQFP